jgi:hypothetical protein
MKVYVVSGSRKVVHQAELVEGNVLLTAEACNVDEVAKKVPHSSLESALAVAKRQCKRCMSQS